MRLLNAWTLDFETFPIGPRPDHYPPKPVGLAWREPGGLTGYETDMERVKEILVMALNAQSKGVPVIFHNGKFDMHVATRWFDIRFQRLWSMVHDTMVMAFLVDPYKSAGLKELGEVWLHMPKDEKDACVEWILANADRLPRFEFVTNSKKEPYGNPTKKNAGAWLAWVPVEILGPYAIGDVERTYKLACTFLPIIEQYGMLEAYKREMAVMPIFMDNEEIGLNVDLNRLEVDIAVYQKAFAYAEEWLRWRLNAQGLNFDAGADLAAILDSRGIFTKWKKNKNGSNSTNKKNMHLSDFNDPQVASVLGYRNRLKTCLKMFMEPWYAQAKARPDGRISTDWNQIQGDGGGTKTGRPSTRNPNFLNISKSFEGLPDGYEHPHFLGLPHLPLVRKYILPNDGEVILKRDFSGQELHIFGEFECGELKAQYHRDPGPRCA